MEKDKRFVSTFVIMSLSYIGLGLLFLLAPTASQRLICYVLGGAAMVVGIMRVVFYFTKNDLSRAFENDLAVGIVALIAGIYLFTQPDAIWNWVPVLLGFAIVFDSIIKLQHSFDLRRGDFSMWWLVLIAALATFVLGLLLIMNTFDGNLLFYYLGIVLIVDGVVNLISILLLFMIRKKVQKALAKEGGEKAVIEIEDAHEAAPAHEQKDNEPSTDTTEKGAEEPAAPADEAK